MLNPIEKPLASELYRAKIVFDTMSKDKVRRIRYLIKSNNPPKDGNCGMVDQFVEVHVPSDGSPATWWSVYERTGCIDL